MQHVKHKNMPEHLSSNPDPNEFADDFNAWEAELGHSDPVSPGDASHDITQTVGEGDPRRIAHMSNSADGILKHRGVEAQVGEDGTSTRHFHEGGFGDQLTETTTPDGVTTYTYRSLYYQGDDRGSSSWSWQRGGNNVTLTDNSELRGLSQKVLNDPKDFYAIESSVDRMVDKTAIAMAEAQAAHQGRLRRALGRMGLGRRPRG